MKRPQLKPDTSQSREKCLFCQGTGVSGYRNAAVNGKLFLMSIPCHCSPPQEHDQDQRRKRK
jgi:hypothetical protein